MWLEPVIPHLNLHGRTAVAMVLTTSHSPSLNSEIFLAHTSTTALWSRPPRPHRMASAPRLPQVPLSRMDSGNLHRVQRTRSLQRLSMVQRARPQTPHHTKHLQTALTIIATTGCAVCSAHQYSNMLVVTVQRIICHIQSQSRPLRMRQQRMTTSVRRMDKIRYQMCVMHHQHHSLVRLLLRCHMRLIHRAAQPQSRQRRVRITEKQVRTLSILSMKNLRHRM